MNLADAWDLVLAETFPTPRMPARELAIWERVKEPIWRDAAQVRFDFSLGDGSKPSEDCTVEERAMWRELSCRRVDVVVMRSGVIRLIELKEVFGTAALGQCLLYDELATEVFGGPSGWTLTVVCRYADDGCVKIAVGYGIEVVTLGELGSAMVI